MAKEKCDYCGKEYEESLFGSLDNGSRACLKCMTEEEKRSAQQEIQKEGTNHV